MQPQVIAIDGPAGSGKTVVGKQVADALGYLYLDTGALYRALTWLALQRGVDVHDGAALASLLQQSPIAIDRARPEDAGFPYSVSVAGQDITQQLNSPAVSENVSVVAAHPEVRAELLPVQRRIAAQGRIVIAGRDIGTVVCPFADLKLYLEAPLSVRIDRRIKQLAERGQHPDPARVAAEMAERDRLDESRAVAPLKPAPDAIILDTAVLSVEQEVADILALVAQRDP